MLRAGINTSGYAVYHGMDTIVPFPTASLRHIGCMVRNIRPIEGLKSICNIEQDLSYCIVTDEYKLIQHQEVLDVVAQICAMHPEWGTPERTVWLSPNGGRTKATWRFPEIEFEIRPGDCINPTIETFSSFDTTLAQYFTLGGFRLVCSNGMVIGKMLAEYRRKHTQGLNLDIAAAQISKGMDIYSNQVGLWKKYAERLATKAEYTLLEELPFHGSEKERILSEMHKNGTVIKWDIESGKKVREVEINSWEMYNILTHEATHNIQDIARQSRILEGVSKGFGQKG